MKSSGKNEISSGDDDDEALPAVYKPESGTVGAIVLKDWSLWLNYVGTASWKRWSKVLERYKYVICDDIESCFDGLDRKYLEYVSETGNVVAINNELSYALYQLARPPSGEYQLGLWQFSSRAIDQKMGFVMIEQVIAGIYYRWIINTVNAYLRKQVPIPTPPATARNFIAEIGNIAMGIAAFEVQSIRLSMESIERVDPAKDNRDIDNDNDSDSDNDIDIDISISHNNFNEIDADMHIENNDNNNNNNDNEFEESPQAPTQVINDDNNDDDDDAQDATPVQVC